MKTDHILFNDILEIGNNILSIKKALFFSPAHRSLFVLRNCFMIQKSSKIDQFKNVHVLYVRQTYTKALTHRQNYVSFPAAHKRTLSTFNEVSQH